MQNRAFLYQKCIALDTFPLYFGAFLHLLLPSKLPALSSTHVLENFNHVPGSLLFPFVFICHPRSSITNVKDRLFLIEDPGFFPSFASPSCHVPAPAGVAAPRSRDLYIGGEDCLSVASSAAHANGTGAKAPDEGHARARMVLGPFAETKGPRRAGAKPRMKKLRHWIPAKKLRE